MKLPRQAAKLIDRRSPVPMYEQLTGELIARIRDQGLVPGDALPGEHVLCDAFGISRTVVRQSLADLESRAIVHRVKGKGTFVGDGKTGETFICSLKGLHEEVSTRGGEVVSEVLRHETVEAPTEVATALELEPGSRVVVLERLRHVDGEPWSWTTTWLPERLGVLLVGVDLTRESLYGVLARHGVRPASARRSVEAALAGPREAEVFQIPHAPVLMVLKSVTRDAEGQAMEYFVAYHRGDRSRFELDVADAATLPGALPAERAVVGVQASVYPA